jgi:hypothetical protein
VVLKGWPAKRWTTKDPGMMFAGSMSGCRWGLDTARDVVLLIGADVAVLTVSGIVVILASITTSYCSIDEEG